MHGSFEDSFDEYLSEEDLAAERTAQEKAAQRRVRHPQKNAELIWKTRLSRNIFICHLCHKPSLGRNSGSMIWKMSVNRKK